MLEHLRGARRGAPALLAVLAALPASGEPLAEGRRGDRGRAHVVLVIGDGMHREHELAASRFLTGTDGGLVFTDPGVMDHAGFATTWDVTTYDRWAARAGLPRYDAAAFDPRVGYDPARGGVAPSPLGAGDAGYLVAGATDSASAATALSTGRKTDEGNVAWLPGDPPDGALTTIAEELRARLGRAVGVVSTVPFSHATPAAFVSHGPSRGDHAGIAREIVAQVRPEVVIGGGHPDFDGADRFRFIAEPEYRALRSGAAGYAFVERERGADGGAALLEAARALPPGGRLFGLFGGPGGGFEPPVPTGDGSGTVRDATPENPSLAEAAVAALEVLSRDPDGFFVVIEQGDVDWANHANDYAWMVGAVYDLDRAVRAVIDFVDRPGDGVDWANTLLVVTSDHGNGYTRARGELARGVLPARDASCAALPAASPPHTACYGGGLVTYQTGGHTNELVGVYAKGARARRLFEAAEGATWYPGTRILDNTQLHGILRRAAGLE